MAQSLTAESNPRRQGSFKNKTSERSSPIPPKGTRQDENYYLTEETVDRKGGQDQLAADSNPRIKVTGVSKEHIHSGMSARMLELSKPKGDGVPRRPKSPILRKVSPLVDKKTKQTKNSATQERSTSPRQGRPLKESPTMKLRKNSAEVVNPKPILKKSTSAAVNTAQLPTQQPRRRSHEQHHQLFSNVEFGKSVRDTFRLKKRKKKTADSDTYGAVDFDNALNNNESRANSSSSKQYHQSKSLKPFGGKLGLGHNFQLISLTNPSWCDHCGDFIWGLNKQCIKCSRCNFTCHHQCVNKVYLDCGGNSAHVNPAINHSRRLPAMSKYAKRSKQRVAVTIGTKSQITDSLDLVALRQKQTSAEQKTSYHTAEERTSLMAKINSYNEGQSPAHQIKLLDASLDYQGFVRVHMCVTRPIHVSAGITRNSWYGLMKPVEHHHNKSSANDSGIDSAIETTFYLPTDANRLVHIHSRTTAHELISILLKKFCVTDHPNKFQLFGEYKADGRADVRTVASDDHPLEILLESASEGKMAKLILRDNLTGSIDWDAFSPPELRNFIEILNMEEDASITKVRQRFLYWKQCVTETIRHRCLEEVHSDPSRVVQVQEPCTT